MLMAGPICGSCASMSWRPELSSNKLQLLDRLPSSIALNTRLPCQKLAGLSILKATNLTGAMSSAAHYMRTLISMGDQVALEQHQT